MGGIVIRIGGTHSAAHEWIQPEGNPFAMWCCLMGWELPSEPFLWYAGVGGWSRAPDDPSHPRDDTGRRMWWVAAENLRHYIRSLDLPTPVDVIAHSHGGQVAILAAASGLVHIRNLITLSTPVRNDMAEYRHGAALSVEHWSHVHGDFMRDYWAWLGRWGRGWRPWCMFRSLAMPEASQNIHLKGHGHSAALSQPELLESLEILE